MQEIETSIKSEDERILEVQQAALASDEKMPIGKTKSKRQRLAERLKNKNKTE